MNHLFKIRLFFSTVSLLTVGCSTVKTRLPYAAVETPALTPTQAVKWTPLEYPKINVYEVSGDASSRPPTIAEANESNISNVGELSSII